MADKQKQNKINLQKVPLTGNQSKSQQINKNKTNINNIANNAKENIKIENSEQSIQGQEIKQQIPVLTAQQQQQLYNQRFYQQQMIQNVQQQKMQQKILESYVSDIVQKEELIKQQRNQILSIPKETPLEKLQEIYRIKQMMQDQKKNQAVDKIQSQYQNYDYNPKQSVQKQIRFEYLQNVDPDKIIHPFGQQQQLTRFPHQQISHMNQWDESYFNPQNIDQMLLNITAPPKVQKVDIEIQTENVVEENQEVQEQKEQKKDQKGQAKNKKQQESKNQKNEPVQNVQNQNNEKVDKFFQSLPYVIPESFPDNYDLNYSPFGPKMYQGGYNQKEHLQNVMNFLPIQKQQNGSNNNNQQTQQNQQEKKQDKNGQIKENNGQNNLKQIKPEDKKLVQNNQNNQNDQAVQKQKVVNNNGQASQKNQSNSTQNTKTQNLEKNKGQNQKNDKKTQDNIPKPQQQLQQQQQQKQPANKKNQQVQIQEQVQQEEEKVQNNQNRPKYDQDISYYRNIERPQFGFGASIGTYGELYVQRPYKPYYTNCYEYEGPETPFQIYQNPELQVRRDHYYANEMGFDNPTIPHKYL